MQKYFLAEIMTKRIVDEVLNVSYYSTVFKLVIAVDKDDAYEKCQSYFEDILDDYTLENILIHQTII